ncbi:TetR/AcrR family transcriptional regulator [Leisingera sp. JC1]|uniref:TetR/AcrR family transcriptional regulator n=1 Tax=Leisingera sp. JC1 TaxID=1855282 RepID=UPI0008032A89|nr:TetR/AcrR family transcriptional regulator [Leisingera sp. JC1]
MQNTQTKSGLERRDWIEAARGLLISGGIQTVTLRRIAAQLGVTTGAYYTHFANLEELLEGLRADWMARNSAPFHEDILKAGPDGFCMYLAYVRIIALEERFSPTYDAAFRAWAQVSPESAAVLKEAERKRIEILVSVFTALGFDPERAQTRANVAYFTQLGYNTLQLGETREDRLMRIPYYVEVESGRKDLLKLTSPEEVLKTLIEGHVE